MDSCEIRCTEMTDGEGGCSPDAGGNGKLRQGAGNGVEEAHIRYRRDGGVGKS